MPNFVKTLLAFLFCIASVSFSILVLSGTVMIWGGQFGGRDGLLANEMAFYASQGYRAGVFLKEIRPDKQVLLLADPGFQENDNIKQLAYALIEGYGSSDVLLDTIRLNENYEELPMPLYMAMSAADFDDAINKHPEAGIIVSTIGLPTELDKLELFKRENAPVLLLLGLPSGPVPGLVNLIQEGKIAAVVISNPEARYDVTAPKERLKAFDIRYMLVTKENLEEVRKHFAE